MTDKRHADARREEAKAGRAFDEGALLNERRLRSILDNLPIGAFFSTPEGKFIYVNPVLADILGYESPEDLIETVNRSSIAEALYEEPARRPRIVEEAAAGKGDWRTFENRYRRKNGEVFTGLLRFCVREDPQDGESRLYGFVEDITERLEMEKTVRESQERYRALAGNIPNGAAFLIDRDKRYVLAEGGALADHDFTPADFEGKHLNEALDPDMVRLLDPVFDRVLGGETTEIEFDYDEEHYLLRAAPLHDEAGRTNQAAVFCQNITRLKNAERALLRNTELLASIREAQSLYILETDNQAAFTAILETLVKMTDSEFGFLDEVIEEADGRRYKRNLAISNIAWDDESRKLYRQLVARDKLFLNLENLSGLPALTGQRVVSNHPEDDPRSGGLPPGHPPIHAFMGLPLYMGERLVGVAGVANRTGGYDDDIAEFLDPLLKTCAAVIDATRRDDEVNRAMQALTESEGRYRALVDGSPNSILVVKDGKYVFANPYGARLLGYENPEDVRGVDVMSSIHPDSHALVIERMRAALDGAANPAIEIKVLTKDGRSLDVESTSIPVKINGESATLVIGHDLTERKRAETERLQFNRRIQQAQKYESLCMLAGGVAHHFNNLMHAIIGNTELALEDTSPHSPARESVDEILHVAQRAASLGRQLLACSGQGRFVSRPVDLARLVKDMRHLLETRLVQGVHLRFDFPDEPLPIKGDPTQLRQALVNLVTNAVEAIAVPPGGEIAIALHRQTVAESEVEEDAFGGQLVAGDYVRLDVIDDGAGMDDSVRQRVFDPFFSTKFTGRGLGLPAVLGIARGHDGAVRVESAPGSGARISLFLPLASQAKRIDAESEASGATGAITPPGQAVLIVDDEQVVLNIGKRIVRRLGYEPLTARDGEEAVEVFDERAGDIAFVLLDARMPGESGEVVFDRLRRRRPDVPIFLSTAYSEEDIERVFSGKDLAGVLRKPWTHDELIQALRRAAGQ